MIGLADDGRSWPRGKRVGFTLLEILLSLTIIALLAGVLVTGAIRLTEPKVVTPVDIFWKAVQETRKKALLSGADEQLRITGKNKTLMIVAHGPEGDVNYPFNATDDLQAEFLSTQKSASAILIGGQLIETGTIPFVTFYGDGTCTPFRVQFHAGASAPNTISIDPWTCAPVLTQQDNARRF